MASTGHPRVSIRIRQLSRAGLGGRYTIYQMVPKFPSQIQSNQSYHEDLHETQALLELLDESKTNLFLSPFFVYI